METAMKPIKRPTMLSATFVKTVNVPGRYGDGRGGLGPSLLVRPGSRNRVAKCWTQSVRLGSRPTSLGLGRYPVVTLALTRQRALENARAVAEGRGAPTFAEAADKVMAIHAGNRNPGGWTEDSWRSSLRHYILPRLGDMPVGAVTGGDVMAVLQPIWTEKRETAKRVRSRIGAVMKWAVAEGHRRAVRGLRARPRARQPRPRGGRLPPQRPVRSPQDAHAAMGRLSRRYRLTPPPKPAACPSQATVAHRVRARVWTVPAPGHAPRWRRVLADAFPKVGAGFATIRAQMANNTRHAHPRTPH